MLRSTCPCLRLSTFVYTATTMKGYNSFQFGISLTAGFYPRPCMCMGIVRLIQVFVTGWLQAAMLDSPKHSLWSNVKHSDVAPACRVSAAKSHVISSATWSTTSRPTCEPPTKLMLTSSGRKKGTRPRSGPSASERRASSSLTSRALWKRSPSTACARCLLRPSCGWSGKLDPESALPQTSAPTLPLLG